MKKKWSSIAVTLLVLAVLVSTSTPVLAQNQNEASVPRPVFTDGLAILAPRISPIGEEVTMTVFERSTQNTVKDAANIPRGIEFAQSIEGLNGVLIVAGDEMGVWGKVKISALEEGR